MAIANLEAIETKVRKLTGSTNSLQLTRSDIIDALNSFYLYDFPAEFRSLKLRDVYTFNAINGIDTYPIDYDNWQTLQYPAYVDKQEVAFFQDPALFYRHNTSTHRQTSETIGTGNGSTVNFTATLGSTPLLRSINNNPIVTTNTANTSSFPTDFPIAFGDSNINRIQNMLITANTANGTTLNVTDDGDGNLIGDVDTTVSNTINYGTGAIDVTFSSAPANTEEVNAIYLPVTLATPTAILLFQNQIILRPVPDRGYTIELEGYRLPSQALLGTGTTTDLAGRPELEEWWETLAVGASKKIYEDRLDADGIVMMDKMLKERYDLNSTRTYADLGSQKIGTLFTQQLDYSIDSNNVSFGTFN